MTNEGDGRTERFNHTDSEYGSLAGTGSGDVDLNTTGLILDPIAALTQEPPDNI